MPSQSRLINKKPGLSSSKSESILNAVQGLTPKVAAERRGMSLGNATKSSAFNTAAVLHVPKINAEILHHKCCLIFKLNRLFICMYMNVYLGQRLLESPNHPP